jgi:phenylalanine-4-hydroxylase
MNRVPQAPTSRPARLRGQYADVRPDYTVEQRYEAYADDDHRVWAELLARQSRLLPRFAIPEFRSGVAALGLDARIPRFEAVSQRLAQLTRWTIVGVPGLIPEHEFFQHLSQRRFPVTTWIRTREELDYLVEPDLFHDFFGHVPLLADPVYADFIELYGNAGQRALENGGLAMLARLYWYGVEFGLMETDAGLRCYGAGILSSWGETQYALSSPVPQRVRFDLARVLRSAYLIDEYQRTYFVIRDFRELMDAAIHTDFLPLYQRYGKDAGIPVGSVLPGEERVPPDLSATAG